MKVSHQEIHIFHEQMIQERMQRQHRMMRSLAIFLVKLGRTLEGFGQAFLEDCQ